MCDFVIFFFFLNKYYRAVVCRHLSLLRMYLSRTFQTCQEQNCRSEPGSSAPLSRSTCSISSASAPASSSGQIFKGVSSVGAKGAQFLQTVSKNVCNKGIINRWVIHSHFSVATLVLLSLGVEGSYNQLLTMQNPSITVTSFPRGSSKGRRARKLEQISTVRHPPVEQNTEIQALQSCWLQQALLTWRKKKKKKQGLAHLASAKRRFIKITRPKGKNKQSSLTCYLHNPPCLLVLPVVSHPAGGAVTPGI